MKKTNNQLKDIPGFPDYSISEDGNIWSKPRRWGYRNGLHKGKWMKPCKNNRYLQVTLSKNRAGIRKYVHHLVLETYVGPRPPGMEGRHLDGNTKNNHVSNLCWGTHSDNMADRIKHGTSCGQRVALKDGDVRKIRVLREKGKTLKHIALQVGVSESGICRIVNGQSRRFVV
jgi:hypothetical protein